MSDRSYIQWKKWDLTLSSVTKKDRAYFDLELNDVDIAYTSAPKVLEVGFGEGRFLNYAREKKWDVTGVELNEGLIKIAKQKGFSAIAPWELIYEEEGKYDLIVAFDVIEHIPHKDILGFLGDLRRTLKKEGIIIMRFPNGNSPLSYSRQNSDVSHCNIIGSRKIQYYMSLSGLYITRIRGSRELLSVKAIGIKEFILRFAAISIRRIIDQIIDAIIYSGEKTWFTSLNLTVIAKKNEEN